MAPMVKNLPAMQETPGSIPGSEKFPGAGISYPLWYSCLENSLDSEAGRLQSMGLQRVGQD